MTYAELRNLLRESRIKVPDVYRAGLYYDYLVQANTFFNTTLRQNAPNGLGNDYNLFLPAISNNVLGSQLAGILDDLIAPAVSYAMRNNLQNNPGRHYADYFTAEIFNANAGIYNQNVINFFTNYPVARTAMDALSQNFQNNIREACQRVSADWDTLQDFFGQLNNGLKLYQLSSIRSTGSDFHKGGKQVLILTFDARKNMNDFIGTDVKLKIVYKPSDMEADCLLVGKSALINHITPGNPFMANSLTEILNQRIRFHRANGQLMHLVELPTYGILPRGYHSPQNNYNIRNSYGYIEFLTYEFDQGILGFGAENDYVLTGDDDNEKIRCFYTAFGQWIATACCFSLFDLHFENMRVHNFMPHLIDLEVSLIYEATNIVDTQIFDALNEVAKSNWEREWVIVNDDVPGQARLDHDYVQDVRKQNRLWRKAGAQKIPVGFNGNAMTDGLTEMLDLIRQAEVANLFQPWFQRINGVLVRYIAYKTGDMRTLRDSVYVLIFTSVNAHPVNLIANNLIPQNILRYITTEYQDYLGAFQINPNILPNLVVLTNAHIGHDLINLDIPVFYHRIGTVSISNSNNNIIQIPVQIVIENHVNPVALNINRQDFFPQSPINNVTGQLQNLTNGPMYNQRLVNLTNELAAQINGENQGHAPVALDFNW